AYHAGWAMFIGISVSRQHFDVQVPAGASIVVAVDGRIELARLAGAIVAHTDDGHIAADDITSPSLDLSSSDGWIEVRNLTTVAGGKYDVSTKDGHIKVAFAHGSDVTVDASTNDGSLRVDGVRYHGDDSVRQTIRIGSGGSAMRVHSDDGSITVTSESR
ncbi:MAG TPA: DUF4097 family beta strand repeat-containing protein, partial [Verrucomicrobiae bacterium]|nr:DUF4097 family beta strand repeat-containing protein [Verrucomicrobiae bacterium]